MFYSQGGAGKTTLMANAADSEYGRPYLHLDIDGSAEAIEHRKDIDVVTITSWDEYIKVFNELKKDPGHGYKTIGCDNLSELTDFCVSKQAGGATESPEIQEYGQATRLITHNIREARDIIARKQGINFIYAAWDADEKDDRGVMKKDIALSPALRKRVPGLVTTVGHLSVVNDPDKRKLSFAPNPRTISKWRRAQTSVAKKIPYEIYYGVENLPLADIFNTLKGGAAWPASKYPSPKAS